MLLVAAARSHADDLDELRKLRDTTVNLVNLLVEQGVLTREKADALIAQAEQAGARAPSDTGSPAAAGAGSTAAGASGTVGAARTGSGNPPPGTVRVPYVPEAVKQQITDQIKEDVLAQAKTERWGQPGAFPDWIHHINWSGDVRVRGQVDRFPTDNSPNAPVEVLQAFGVNIQNSTESNKRLRLRARVGLDATIGDTVAAGVRLATGGVGSGGNPASENQTLGNYESRSTVGVDRAFLAYHPVSWVTLAGGRLANPFFRPTTLVWADDVSLEGVTGRLDAKLGSHGSLYAIGGAFPILQNDPSPLSVASSKWLFAYQSGLDLKFSASAEWRLGVAYYDYRNIEAIPNPSVYTTEYSATAAPFRQTGNTVFDINALLNTQNGTQNYVWGLASRFHELNVSSSVDFRLAGPVHAILDGDWVSNLGFNQQEILRRTGYLLDKQTRGWQSKVSLGYPDVSKKHAWQAWVGYRYVQRDATVDAFTDSDFHLGGTDARGYFFGGRYAFEKDSAVSLRWFSAKEISGVELAGASQLGTLPLAIDVLQLDVSTAF